MKVLLIDVSAIAHPLFHVTADDPNPNAISDGIVSKVRSLSGGYDRTAICIERGKSFRCDISAEYKAHREAKPASFYAQYDRAVDILGKDGHLVLGAATFEADDIIATATGWLVEREHDVVIATGDKDLLQLVSSKVAVYSLQKAAIIGQAGVVEKFGVLPAQMREYLSLVGDSSDGVQGAKGIGPVKAKELLSRFQSVAGIYAALNAGDASIANGTAKALRESAGQVQLASKLVALRFDAPIDCEAILAERKPQPLVAVEDDDPIGELDGEEITPGPTLAQTVSVAPANDSTALVPVDARWEMQLEPRDGRGALALAQRLMNSRALKGYGTPEGIMAVIIAGREMGVPAMAALRGFCLIEGKLGMYAQFAHGLVLRAGVAEYVECTESTATQSTWVTKRKGGSREQSLTYTVEQARRAGVIKSGGAWETRPEEMCRKQALHNLLRMVYPDVVGNLYDPDEMGGAA